MIGDVVSSAQEEVEEAAGVLRRYRGRGQVRLREVGERLLDVADRGQGGLAGPRDDGATVTLAAVQAEAAAGGARLQEVLQAAGVDPQAEGLAGDHRRAAPVVAARVGERVEGLVAGLGRLVGEVLEEA